MTLTTKVLDQNGKEVGSVQLKQEIFGIEPNEAVVHQYIVNYLARQRQGTHDTKTRKEVRGGGKKPWKQKGTGRARAGTIRSPLWRGGGTVFGPHPRSYGYEFPKQMKLLAIRSVFSDKFRSEAVRIVDKIELNEYKTKAVTGLLANMQVSGKKALILDEGRNEFLTVSCRNVPALKLTRAGLANGYDLLNADVLILTRAGLTKVEEVFG